MFVNIWCRCLFIFVCIGIFCKLGVFDEKWLDCVFDFLLCNWLNVLCMILLMWLLRIYDLMKIDCNFLCCLILIISCLIGWLMFLRNEVVNDGLLFGVCDVGVVWWYGILCVVKVCVRLLDELIFILKLIRLCNCLFSEWDLILSVLYICLVCEMFMGMLCICIWIMSGINLYFIWNRLSNFLCMSNGYCFFIICKGNVVFVLL